MSSEKGRATSAARRHWRRTVRVMTMLLAVWALAGLGCGVLLAGFLNQWTVGGFPVGFWFAQAGSVIVFVILILVFALVMNRIDARYRREIHSDSGSDS